MPDTYPPEHHVLSDLRIELERGEDDRRVRLPLVPELLDAAGVVHAGALGIVTDVFGGGLSIEEASPDWAVTSQLELHVLRRIGKGPVEVTGQALRAGRTRIVLEVEVHDGEGTLGAVGSMSFTKILRRPDNPMTPHSQARRSSFANANSGLRGPFLEVLGIRPVPDAPDTIEIPLAPYVMNSVGALQGGVVIAMLADAAERVARATLEGPLHTTHLSVQFLSLGKAGPLRARARTLQAGDGHALLRVELRDLGQADRLVSLGTVHVGGLS